MILVTGATGTIGSELLPLLSERGATVRALSRRSMEGEGPEGVEWVRGDLAERGKLPAIFAGARRLFLLSGNVERMVLLERNAIRAAVEAGVEHVVLLSALGASDHSKSVIGLWHHNCERLLDASGLAHTVLRPHHFMQNLLDPLVFDRASGTVYSASGDGRIPFLDTRDIAAAAAAVLASEEPPEEVLTLTGPRALSYGEATEILSAVLARPLTFVAESDAEQFARRRAAGQPTWLIAAQLAIAGYQRAGGPTERVTDTVERVTGRPARSFESFARDHATRFQDG